MDVKLFVTRGLGDNSYLISSGQEAVLVDPQRDIWRFKKVLENNNLRLRYILESHVHNDYLSGALALKDSIKGLELALPAKGDYEFEHRKMRDGDSLNLGDLTFEVMETPGHTYEHISWIAKQNDQPVGAFTGGSLIIGSAGRTDLLGHEHTHDLTVKQYESVQKLSQLPGSVRLYPTHGAGSFCTSSNPSSQRTALLSEEKSYNQALNANSVDDFLDKQLSGLLNYPSYYPHMAPINRKGPEIFHQLPEVQGYDAISFQTHMQEAYVIDVRMGSEYAQRHIRHTYNFELKPSAANYIGWIIPFNAPIMIIPSKNGYKDVEDIQTQLFRIGYDNILGYLEGGISAWANEGLPLHSYSHISAKSGLDHIHVDRIIDIRDKQEIEELPLSGAYPIFLPDLVDRVPREHGPFYVMCVSGQRAATAASILEMKGKQPILITEGGIEEVLNQVRTP